MCFSANVVKEEVIGWDERVQEELGRKARDREHGRLQGIVQIFIGED
jgi:hypothetical protein